MSTTSKPSFSTFGMLALTAAAGLAALSGCEQRGAACATAHGAYAVKLTVRSNPDSCEVNPGGVYGLATYNHEGKDNRPDLNRALMAIQSDELATMVLEAEFRLEEAIDPGQPTYARGDFTAADPNSRGLCEVPTLTKVDKTIPVQPAIEDDDEDESLPEIPEMNFGYEWSGLKFLVSEANQGTRFTGTLKYTANGCTAEYDAVGLYPAVYCGDDDGNPEDRWCSATPIAELGMVFGSGISPDFKTQCDPVLLLCVLAERPPTD
jgi:hypothetical protein